MGCLLQDLCNLLQLGISVVSPAWDGELVPLHYLNTCGHSYSRLTLDLVRYFSLNITSGMHYKGDEIKKRCFGYTARREKLEFL